MAKCQIASWSGFANGSTGQGIVGGGVMLSLSFASCLLAFCLCLYSCSEAPPEAFPPISHKHGSPKERRRSQGCEAPAGLDLDQAAAFGNVLGRDGLGGAGECPTRVQKKFLCPRKIGVLYGGFSMGIGMQYAVIICIFCSSVTPNWFNQIASTNEAGLLREMALMQAMQLELTRQNNELLDRITVLSALGYLTQLEDGAGKELNTLYVRMVGAQQ